MSLPLSSAGIKGIVALHTAASKLHVAAHGRQLSAPTCLITRPVVLGLWEAPHHSSRSSAPAMTAIRNEATDKMNTGPRKKYSLGTLTVHFSSYCSPKILLSVVGYFELGLSAFDDTRSAAFLEQPSNARQSRSRPGAPGPRPLQ